MLELKMITDLQAATPAEITFNFEELKAELSERLEYYSGLVVTEDGIKDAKADRAKLNKLRTAIDTRRKDIKREYLKPYNDFEGKIKELTLLIDQPIAAIDTQLESYEERRKQAKMENIQEAYEETFNAWSSTIREIIPLNRILDQKWLNATTSMGKVREDLENWAKRVNADLLALDTIEPEYAAAVKQKYVDTLDVSIAISHKEALKAAEEVFKAREAEREAREAEKATEAKSEALAAQLEQQPTMQTEEKRYMLRLEFNVTRNQAIALKNFIEASQIEYKKIN